jgi:preprotein translocase subunit Sss1
MEIKEVFTMIKHVFAEMKNPDYEELKRITRIAMLFLDLQQSGPRRRI